MTRRPTPLTLLILIVALLAPTVGVPAEDGASGGATAVGALGAAGVDALIVTVADGSGVLAATRQSAGPVAVIAPDTVAVPVSQPDEALAVLAAASGVRAVEPDWPIHAATDGPDDPWFPDLWGLHNTGQSAGLAGADIAVLDAWQHLQAHLPVAGGSSGPLGDDVVVAISDSGIDAGHPDLADRMWSNDGQLAGCPAGSVGYDHVMDACALAGGNTDGSGHGTHVAGTVAATMGNGLGTVGVAPHARLLDLRFLDATGSGWTSGAIAGISQAVALVDAGVNLRVINASWGGGVHSAALADAIAAASDVGILFVTAAGNDGNDVDLMPQYPCGYTLPAVVCVGATDRTDSAAWFSNHGDVAVDLAAPGVAIRSTVPGGGYGLKQGTSMAAPHVSGAAALLAACGADLAGIRAALLGGVDTPATLVGHSATGGRLNIASSLTAAACVLPDPLAPGIPTPAMVNAHDDTVSWDPGSADTFTAEVAELNSDVWTPLADGLAVPHLDVGDLPEGRWALRVTGVRDSDGAQAVSAVRSPFIVDRNGPVVTDTVLDGPSATHASTGDTWYAPGMQVILSAADPPLADATPGSGVAGLAVIVDTHGPVADVRISDVAGNRSTDVPVAARVDARRPTVAIMGCPTAAVHVGQAVVVHVAAADVGVGLDEDPSGSHRLGTSTAGAHSATFVATDLVGNTRSKRCDYAVASPQGPVGPPPGGGSPPPPPAPALPSDPPEPTPTPEPTTEPTPEPSQQPPDEALGGLGGPDGPPPPRIDQPDPAGASLRVSRLRFASAPGFADRILQPAADARRAAYAVLARDDAFADALAGAPLSADGPLLLTDAQDLDASAAEELARVVDLGGTVYLLGGEGALSAQVAQRVAALGLTPARLAGPSRIETAVAIAQEVITRFGTGTDVLVARAYGPAGNPTAAWADGISGGAYGAQARVPLVLTASEALHPAAQDFIHRSGLQPILLGGQAALADTVASALGPLVASRVSGANRAATAVAVAQTLWGVSTPLDRAVLINGWHLHGWAYGLTAAGLAADMDAPLLLVTDVLPDATRNAIGCTDTTIMGAADSVSADLEASLTLLCGR